MANIGSTTLGAMTLAAQQRADRVNSGFITATEWTNMVNSSCQQLYDKLVEAYGSDYEVATPSAFSSDGVNDHFSLPTDFYKLLGVDVQISASSTATTGWISLRRFNFADRNRYTLPNVQTLWGRTNLLYRLSGAQLWLIPLPQGGQQFRIWYIPRFVPLVNASDSFDAINGWEEWVVNDVAMKALVKDESDISGVAALQQSQEMRLASIMENRDAGSPATITDLYQQNGGDGSWPGSEW